MITIGSMSHLIPRLYGRTEMYSVSLIAVHFWLATVGTVLYIAAMWVNGIMPGLMWRAVNADGTLMYTFIESVEASGAGYVVRTVGGLCWVVGMLVMAFNVAMTVRGKQRLPRPQPQAAA